ncbi:diguanylate cyclase [Solirubrobacter ginsenosidimutans]|uniref:Diguanylate cyclase n=1 Tax=Solirubrobacter ginsenosidimutans TaxID=490573 RepID=A0A9X3MX26_9ACTN|nr:diguanylate cyclase [Solirubrobacter ginsenosidimutans]MDA0164601.1 diguanylate cyclase [Solirubrobacter ginsenosidimutans]
MDIGNARYLTISLKNGADRPTAGDVIRRTALLPHALFAGLLCATAVFAATGEPAVRNAIQVTAVLAMAVQAGRCRKGTRVGWGLLAISNVTWAIGDFDPFKLNAFYLASYVFAHAGLVMLVAAQARVRWRTALALDGVIAGLAAATVLTSFVSTALEGNGVRVPATALAGDATLVTTIVFAFVLSGWRPARAWWVIAAGEVILVTLDLTTVSVVVPTRAMLVAWVVAFLVTSYAVFHPSTARVRPGHGIASAGVPVVGGAIAVVLLMHAALTGGRPLTVWLAGGALVAGLIRGTLLIADNHKLLRQNQLDATTDKLTGLPNRRALERDLDRAFATRAAHTLAFFDLDGFKEYNDAFGHGAGDALLQRLAPALGGYRLGGDEFCLLLPGSLAEDAPAIRRAVEALSERGDGFSITASFGLVVLPDEAADAADALKRADERMYARKRRRRGGQAGQARDVLIQVLAERGSRDDEVPQLAADVARRLGLTGEEIDVLVRAAELRDVGMIAVPYGADALAKLHPVIGERILAAAESMRPVARIVRAAHERYDGTGFPDGLKGEQIPLAARIIGACAGADDPLLSEAVCASRAARAPGRSASSLAGSARTQ